MNKKVVVGISGGVDSAVTAYLLLKEGYEVVGMTMQQFIDVPFLKDAEEICDKLGIELKVVDMTEIFKKEIMDYFAKEYLQGRTPNPCSFCNPKIKWQALLSTADSVGADYVATGHYAVVDCIDGKYAVKNSVTATKDQTYALSFLSQDALRRTLMPLGKYEKEEVREIALKAGIPVATKADSQDICFIQDGDYASFIGNGYSADKPGMFVDREGKIIGPNKGIIHYTIGQRKGLGIAMGHPVFVTGIDAKNNRVVIGENEDLFTKEFFCSNLNFQRGTDEELPKKLLCKIRYAHKGSECLLEKVDDNLYRGTFTEPVRAITPGQTAVFYEDGYVFAGAVIE